MPYVTVTLLQSANSILTTFTGSLQKRALANFSATGVKVGPCSHYSSFRRMLGMIPLAACLSMYVVPRSRFANFGRKNETDLPSFWSRWLVFRMGLCLGC